MTIPEVENAIGKDRVAAFWEWMSGQTLSEGKDGETVVPDDDVRRFVCNVPVTD